MTGAKQIIVGGVLAFGLAAPAIGAAQTAEEPSDPTAIGGQKSPKEDAASEDPKDTSGVSDNDERTTPSAETRKKVGTLLDGIESAPSAAQWKALDDDAVLALVEIVNDKSLPVVRRGRAVTALVHFDGDEARNAVTTLVESDRTPKHLLRKAVRTLGTLGGEAALPALEPHLSSSSARIREATIDAVGEVRTASAKSLLRARFSVEPQNYLKKKIGKYLSMPTRTSKSLEPLADVPVEESAQ
jgi:HEAT repeat protein